MFLFQLLSVRACRLMSTFWQLHIGNRSAISSSDKFSSVHNHYKTSTYLIKKAEMNLRLFLCQSMTSVWIPFNYKPLYFCFSAWWTSSIAFASISEYYLEAGNLKLELWLIYPSNHWLIYLIPFYLAKDMQHFQTARTCKYVRKSNSEANWTVASILEKNKLEFVTLRN